MGTNRDQAKSVEKSPGEDIAIIGMACVFPGAPDLATYWQNILAKADCVTDAPVDWDFGTLYDPDAVDKGRIYCRRGGFLGQRELKFNPIKYGIMPSGVEGAEPDQFLAMRVAYDAMDDAGYLANHKYRENTAVILGRGAYVNAGLMHLVQHGWVIEQTLEILKRLHPEHTEQQLHLIKEQLRASLPPMSAELVPGQIPNITTGRIANRLDLRGPNYTVDAACASSLIAIDIGAKLLSSRECDLALVGGVQGGNTPFSYIHFCLINALSRQSQIRPFDSEADGTILGEGAGMVVLKRRRQAERDGDRIYANIKSVGTSSDGKALGLLAPRLEGAEVALRRAYEATNCPPTTIGLIEAHGTATPAGDMVEVNALKRVLGDGDGMLSRCAMGSVKSMIGHLLGASGIAGLIKTALALYHRVLPPSLNCDQPNPEFELEKTRFYINTETRPWIHNSPHTPRRAGVNALGFGGINAHAIVEEHTAGNEHEETTHQRHWDSEVFIFQGDSRGNLIETTQGIQDYLSQAPDVHLRDLAYTLNTALEDTPFRLAIIATSLQDLQTKLAHAAKKLEDQQCAKIKDRRGIYFFDRPLGRQGKLAFLFPGEGSQYVNMLADLCIQFPEVRICFDRMDQIFYGHKRGYVASDFIFPPPTATESGQNSAEEKLRNMDGAIEAILTANEALFQLLGHLEIRPDVVLGHSTGEYSAMRVSGIFSLIDEVNNGERLRQLNQDFEEMVAQDGIPRAHLIAIGAGFSEVTRFVEQIPGDLYVAMDNCPHQTVIVAPESVAPMTIEELDRNGLIYQVLPFDRPYHTPLFHFYALTLRQYLERWPVASPTLPMYSCTTTAPYPDDPGEIRQLAVDHWVRRVEFSKTIERMYAEDVRIFLEVGPRGNLTAFVNDILRGRDHLAVAADVQTRSGILQLNHMVGMLAASGVSMKLNHLYRRRAPNKLALHDTEGKTRERHEAEGTMTLSLQFPKLQVPPREAGTLRPEPALPPHEKAVEQTSRQLAAGWIPEPSAQEEEEGVHQTPLASHVFQEYFTTMERFLETQSEVMHHFLTEHLDSPGLAATTSQSSNQSPALSVQKQYEQPEPLRQESYPTCPAEAESTKQEAEKEPVNSSSHPSLSTVASVESMLLEVVSERTGYPPEMLELTLNLEADLGIDSIKRLEIVGALSERDSRLQVQDLEHMAGLKTLGEMIGFLQGLAEGTPRELFSSVPEPLSPASDTVDKITHGPPLFPFIDEVISFIPEKELVFLCTLDLDKDLFLRDHTLGGQISRLEQGLHALPVMPLTMSMEIMAEAAATLVPGNVLIGMRDIQAYRWIALDESPVSLQVRASRSDKEEREIEVRIFDFVQGEREASTPVLEGKIVFASTYPEAPMTDGFSLHGEKSSKWTPESLYSTGMFHGPRWQGVSSIDKWAEDGSVSTLKVLPTNGFFRSEPSLKFVTDPIVLDAAGQIVGFWTMEHLERGFIVFPYRLKALDIYHPQPPAHQNVRCQARINLVGSQLVSSDIDIIAEDGRLWMRLETWEDKRFDLPPESYAFLLSPIKTIPSRQCNSLLTPFADASSFCCVHSGPLFESDDNFWRRVFAHLILNHSERQHFRTLGASEKRQTHWLLGRLVAKDAVRIYVRQHHGMTLGSADVEIGHDRYGRPQPTGAWLGEVGTELYLSLAHTDKLAVAVVGQSAGCRGVGVDVEAIRPMKPRFAETFLTHGEQRLLSTLEKQVGPEWLLRLWCSKEAAAKALGRGFGAGLKNLVIRNIDSKRGTVDLTLQGKLVEEFPDLADLPLTVHTMQQGSYIIAATVLREG